MFKIAIVDRRGPVGMGEIVIGSFRERFEMVFAYWTAQQYEEHWKFALGEIVSGRPKAALVTSITEPRTANFLFWWPIYREGETVFVQHQILMFDQIKGRFSVDHMFDFIQDRETEDEDGNKISEWQTTIPAIETFLRTQESGERS